MRGTLNGTTQGVTMLVLRATVIGFAIMLWSEGRAGAGDIAFVLTSFFVLQGYLRDVGMHVRNVQRSVNDMEELVDIHAEPIGVVDRPNAQPIAIEEGGIEFQDVTFHYGGHATPLYRDFSLSIRPGERVGLVGHSGSGKTTFVKLIQHAMERLMVGRTTLVIAHRLSTVRALDRLLVFDKGRVIEEGDHASLIRREGGIYRRLFERQALELTKGFV